MNKDLYQSQGAPRFCRNSNTIFLLINKFGHKLQQNNQCARLSCFFATYRCAIFKIHILYKESFLNTIQLDYLQLQN
jgi:hypothetical protein